MFRKEKSTIVHSQKKINDSKCTHRVEISQSRLTEIRYSFHLLAAAADGVTPTVREPRPSPPARRDSKRHRPAPSNRSYAFSMLRQGRQLVLSRRNSRDLCRRCRPCVHHYLSRNDHHLCCCLMEI
jgi:hypothetical protein